MLDKLTCAMLVLSSSSHSKCNPFSMLHLLSNNKCLGTKLICKSISLISRLLMHSSRRSSSWAHTCPPLEVFVSRPSCPCQFPNSRLRRLSSSCLRKAISKDPPLWLAKRSCPNIEEAKRLTVCDRIRGTKRCTTSSRTAHNGEPSLTTAECRLKVPTRIVVRLLTSARE